MYASEGFSSFLLFGLDGLCGIENLNISHGTMGQRISWLGDPFFLPFNLLFYFFMTDDGFGAKPKKKHVEGWKTATSQYG